MNPATWLAISAICAALAVAAGAFGAHGLKAHLPPDLMAVFRTGAEYHMTQALGLGLVAVVGMLRPGISITGPAWALLAGIVFFSGSLYLLAITGVRWLGAITPIGGTLFIVGWVWLAVAAFRSS